MTEPDRTQNARSDKSEPVTAARRNGNLDTIRKQPGWQTFPDCIPLPMRTSKSGKVTEFGNTKLRIIERIAVNSDFGSALAFLNDLTDNGSRLLSLRDLEACASRFDPSRKHSSKRGSSSAPVSTGPSHVDDDENYQLLHPSLDSWNHVGLDGTSIAMHSGPAMNTLKRPSPDNVSYQSMSKSPVEVTSKRTRMDHLFDAHTADFLFSPSDPDLSGAGALDFRTFAQPTGTPPIQSSLPSPSPHQNPARALLSLHPHAGSIFSNLNTAFDELLARIDDQQQLVKSALDQLRMSNQGLDCVVSAVNGSAEQELEAELMAAHRNEASARLDLQQARSARDVIDIQYGHIGTSLSRALLGTVRDEYTRAEEAMARAQADVESARQKLDTANSREQNLRRARDVAEVGIDQLQRQTRFWLKRLAEAGVKLTDQLGTLQGGNAGQSSTHG